MRQIWEIRESQRAEVLDNIKNVHLEIWKCYNLRTRVNWKYTSSHKGPKQPQASSVPNWTGHLFLLKLPAITKTEEKLHQIEPQFLFIFYIPKGWNIIRHKKSRMPNGQITKNIQGKIIKSNNPPDNPYIGVILHNFNIRNRLFSQ